MKDFTINQILTDNSDSTRVVIMSGGLDSTILANLLCEKYGNEKIYALSFFYNQKHSFELECVKKTVEKLQIHHKIINLNLFEELNNATSLTKQGLKVPEVTDDVVANSDPNKHQYTTYVPFRNMMLLTIACSYAESIKANRVYYGAQKQDTYGYWDCTPQFVKSMNSVARLSNWNIEIIAPFMELSKADELNLARKHFIDVSNTWTCYNGPDENGLACGTCPSCQERKLAFEKVGLTDPVQYKN